MRAKFQVVNFSRSGDTRGFQNLKVGPPSPVCGDQDCLTARKGIHVDIGTVGQVRVHSQCIIYIPSRLTALRD